MRSRGPKSAFVALVGEVRTLTQSLTHSRSPVHLTPVLVHSYNFTMASDNGLTLTVVGCGESNNNNKYHSTLTSLTGTMGIAILGGIMDSLNSSSPSSEQEQNLPPRLPSRFNATCRSDRSASRIRSELEKYNANLHIIQSDNVRAIKEADVVLLACKPFYVKDVLQAEGVREALEGKLLISILAGVPEAQLEELLYPDLSHEQVREKVTIVRTMPNTASKVRESMTVINQSTLSLKTPKTSFTG
jgi:pyrroline-5-carboxylate reductase